MQLSTAEADGAAGRLMPPSVLSRFRADLARLCAPDARLALAVSGGPDSLALLLLAHASGAAIEAATVDHRLRPEAAEEAQFVARLCGQWGIRHTILPLQHPPSGNISAWARHARYAALEDWRAAHGLDVLVTAHHADDQLETIIMRLNRGAGLAGLAGIRAQRDRIVRPLLGWRKAELTALVEAAGITPVDDPSNKDDRFDRARLRKALAQADWLDPVAASKSAHALGSAEAALAWAATQEAERRISKTAKGSLKLDPQDLPFELLRRLVRDCLCQIAPDSTPRDDELRRLIARLEAGEVATLAGVKAAGGQYWQFTKVAPPRPIKRNS